MSSLTRDGVAGVLFSLKGKGKGEIRSTLTAFLESKGLSGEALEKVLDDLPSYPEYQPQGD